MSHEHNITVERDGKHYIESSVEPGKVLEGPFNTAEEALRRSKARSGEFNPDSPHNYVANALRGGADQSLPTVGEIEAMHDTIRQQRGLSEGQYWANPAAPLDPRQQYDYLGAIREPGSFGTDPMSGEMHGLSRFKAPGHPNRFVAHGGGLEDTMTGQPADVMDSKILARILKNQQTNMGGEY